MHELEAYVQELGDQALHKSLLFDQFLAYMSQNSGHMGQNYEEP